MNNPDQPTEAQPLDPIDPGLLPLVDQAVADLAERLAVAPETITVESARLVTWTDRGFLGSSVDNLRQIQVPADGSEIVLRCESHATPGPYRYRTGGNIYPARLHPDDQP